jgi:hypothetical protein
MLLAGGAALPASSCSIWGSLSFTTQAPSTKSASSHAPPGMRKRPQLIREWRSFVAIGRDDSGAEMGKSRAQYWRRLES